MSPEQPSQDAKRTDWAWKVPDVFGQERLKFRSGDTIHRADSRQAVQIVEEDAFRISYRVYNILEGAYILEEETQTSLGCFVKLLQKGAYHG